MSKRAFTAQHMLQDAEQEFADAVYHFRQAERDMTPDYDAARRTMNEAEGKVETIRQFIYSGNPYKIWEQQIPSEQFDRCPAPAWT